MTRGKILLTTILLTSISSFAAEKTSNQYWRETGFNFPQLESFLKDKCQLSSKSFVACVNALNEAALSLKPAGVFLGEVTIRTREQLSVGGFVKTFGTLNLYTLAPTSYEKMSAKEQLEKMKSIQEAQNQNISEIYNKGLAKQVDIPTILDQLHDELIKNVGEQNEAALAANIVNTFLGAALDPHTRWGPKAADDDSYNTKEENFGGVGLTVASGGGSDVVGFPMENGPAVLAGIRARDIIETVDGVKVSGLKSYQVANLVRGKIGSRVEFGILRKDQRLNIAVTRSEIVHQNVEVKTVSDLGQTLGYLKIAEFMSTDSCQDVENAIGQFEKEKVHGIILDLRFNPGGRLDQAACIASLFVGRHMIAQVKDLEENKMKLVYGYRSQKTYLPMVTLINGKSASGSEVLAGALQDYRRSWIAGDRSFGKGTVQHVDLILNNKINYWKTFQRFYQPSGRTNQVVGIIPDFQIDPSPYATDDEKFVVREGDYYKTALPPVGKPWVQPRPEEVSKVQSCVNGTQSAKAHYSEHYDDAVLPDYQVLTAESILSCSR